jgi:Holliday junction resolvase-like predicted endonuclease
MAIEWKEWGTWRNVEKSKMSRLRKTKEIFIANEEVWRNSNGRRFDCHAPTHA